MDVEWWGWWIRKNRFKFQQHAQKHGARIRNNFFDSFKCKNSDLICLLAVVEKLKVRQRSNGLWKIKKRKSYIIILFSSSPSNFHHSHDWIWRPCTQLSSATVQMPLPQAICLLHSYRHMYMYRVCNVKVCMYVKLYSAENVCLVWYVDVILCGMQYNVNM